MKQGTGPVAWLRVASLSALAAALLGACSGAPPAPDWQLNARSALDRAAEAWLSGDAAVADIEWKRARTEAARTGRADLMARVELSRCAAELASLTLDGCSGIDALLADATESERAYARYLRAQPQRGDEDWLPPTARAVVRQWRVAPQQAAAAAGQAPMPTTATDAQAMASTLQGADSPWSRLVAAGVLLRASRADAATLQLAVDAASAQGWRRALLAWLGAQAAAAEARGDAATAAAARRRIERVSGAR